MKGVQMSMGVDGTVRVECGEEHVLHVLHALMQAVEERHARAAAEPEERHPELPLEVEPEPPDPPPAPTAAEPGEDREVSAAWLAGKFGLRSSAPVRRWLAGGPEPLRREANGLLWYSLRAVEEHLRRRTEAATGTPQHLPWPEFDTAEGQMWASLSGAAAGADYLRAHRVLSGLRRAGRIRYCIPLGTVTRGGFYYYLMEDVRTALAEDAEGKGGAA